MTASSISDPSGATLAPGDLERIQRRTLTIIVVCQVLGGLGFGATLTMGSLLFVDLSGREALGGMATTMSTLGAAAAGIPLAWLASRSGRRVSLGTGAAIAAIGAAVTVVAAAASTLPLLFVGIALLGMGNAANLQARFAATDLAPADRRGRHLSIVVWSTTIGAAIGPNLLDVGERLGFALGLPHYTGPFAITFASQVVAALVYFVALRPDPLLTANAANRGVDAAAPRSARQLLDSRRLYRFAVFAVAASHSVMVGVMAMTPVHLEHHGATLALVGITISLHVVGMFAFSPIFGWLADRLGRIRVILLGQTLLASGLVVNAVNPTDYRSVTVGLSLIGLGWSAATIAGSALVTESTPLEVRTRNQGRNDVIMSLAGGGAGALAGPVLAASGYGGLSFAGGVIVASVVVTVALVVRRERAPISDREGSP